MFVFFCSVNSSYYHERSESSPIHYSNRYDSKVSNTFERLQLIIKNNTNDSNEPSEKDYSSSPPSSSTSHDNSHWSSSLYSSKMKSDTNMQTTKQTLTYNDTEKLLSMVRRLRNQ